MPAMKPPAAANSALYDKTQRSGNLPKSFIAKIGELMTSLKGATPDRRGRRPTYATRQASKVARTGGK